MLQVIERGNPTTGYMRFGDRRVRIEMFDKQGRSIFGAIDQVVEPYRKGERREETKSRALVQWVITQ
jgi:fumarylacetoacetate (FAA) hydrolase